VVGDGSGTYTRTTAISGSTMTVTSSDAQGLCGAFASHHPGLDQAVDETALRSTRVDSGIRNPATQRTKQQRPLGIAGLSPPSRDPNGTIVWGVAVAVAVVVVVVVVDGESGHASDHVYDHDLSRLSRDYGE